MWCGQSSFFFHWKWLHFLVFQTFQEMFSHRTLLKRIQTRNELKYNVCIMYATGNNPQSEGPDWLVTSSMFTDTTNLSVFTNHVSSISVSGLSLASHKQLYPL